MLIGFTDGEMTNLSPKFGQLLCAGILDFDPGNKNGSNLRILTLDDYKGRRWDDKGLAKRWRDALEEYDIIVTWNGRRFDVPFLNERLARWGLRPLNSPRHEDLMYTARHHMRCMGVRDSKLKTVAQHLRLPVQKTEMLPEQWVMASGGHYPSYQYILRHCGHDVKVLNHGWYKLKHLIREIK